MGLILRESSGIQRNLPRSSNAQQPQQPHLASQSNNLTCGLHQMPPLRGPSNNEAVANPGQGDQNSRAQVLNLLGNDLKATKEPYVYLAGKLELYMRV